MCTVNLKSSFPDFSGKDKALADRRFIVDLIFRASGNANFVLLQEKLGIKYPLRLHGACLQQSYCCKLEDEDETLSDTYLEFLEKSNKEGRKETL